MRFGTLVRLCVVALLAALLPVIAAAPAQAGAPTGDVNGLVSPEPGRVHVTGWALDPANQSVSVDIHVYVGGYGVNIGPANSYRPDVPVNSGYAGDYHGFDKVIDIPLVGDFAWEVYAIDPTGPNNVLIESGRVTIADPTPNGVVDPITSPAHRTVKMSGWASDPSATTTPVKVEAYIGGSFSTPGVEFHALTANTPRSDGTLGFSSQFTTAKTGVQDVYVYAKNVPGTPGQDRLISISKVTIQVDTTAPTTTITSAPSVATPTDIIRVTYASSEPNSTFGCRWDSAPFETCSGTSTTSLPPGEHTFQVRATDAAGNTDATPASAVVVVSNYVTQPLPGADRAVKVGAVKKKSKLRINVDPDSATDNYRVTIQRKNGKKWAKVKRVRTRGDRDVVVVNLGRGKYRVVLPKQDLSPALRSGVVRLKR